jgi:molybdate transport repressor ModE-like protein
MLLMALLWVVCGAGKGVGKTQTAQALSAALGGAPLAKQGHGEARAEKPLRLLRDDAEVAAFLAGVTPAAHAVLESNSAVRRGMGDVVVFVEGQPAGSPRRPDADALRARAGVVLAPEVPVATWRAALDPLPLAADERAAVLDALLGSLRWSPAVPILPRAKVWFEPAAGQGFGRGLVEILDHVDRTGTLREAARAAGMSYRHAWDLVRAAEEQLGVALIAARPGGARGGSSSLTALGQRLLRAHRQLEEEVAAFAAARFAAVLPPGPPP